MSKEVLGRPGKTRATALEQARQRARFARLRGARHLARLLNAARRRRGALLAALLAPLALLLCTTAWLIHLVYFDRGALPDLDAFIRFEPPTTGVVRDLQGTVMIELAREYRRL
ncbi:MAG TPA: hypothetical protein VLA75_00620, partial [Thermoanaerobaculia bacterium]|nr:hypothetical protein [Thermoanaerobaculia bacterium]